MVATFDWLIVIILMKIEKTSTLIVHWLHDFMSWSSCFLHGSSLTFEIWKTDSENSRYRSRDTNIQGQKLRNSSFLYWDPWGRPVTFFWASFLNSTFRLYSFQKFIKGKPTKFLVFWYIELKVVRVLTERPVYSVFALGTSTVSSLTNRDSLTIRNICFSPGEADHDRQQCCGSGGLFIHGINYGKIINCFTST